MCEFTDKEMLNKAINSLQELTPDEAFPQFISQRFPFVFQRGHCPVCGVQLSKKERRPSGKCTRSMCQNCYDSIVSSGIGTHCLVCSKPLPKEKIIEQLNEPREAKHCIEDGICMDRWTLIHNVAVMEPDIAGHFAPSKKLSPANPVLEYNPVKDDLLNQIYKPTQPKQQAIPIYKRKPVITIRRRRKQ